MVSFQRRIFISHSHSDNAFVTQMAQNLRQALGIEQAVWYDILGLHGGDTWWEKIVEELTTRDIFLLILSPEAMDSQWVRREINIALNEGKTILPILYRNCSVRADLKIYQIISFLAPKTYQAAFQEVLEALGLPSDSLDERKGNAQPTSDPASALLTEIKIAFYDRDWPDVIRKANYLISHMPASASSTVYRLQGLAFKEEGKIQQAQAAFEAALALVSDRKQRLMLLSDSTALLVQQRQWVEVLQRANEALRIAPNDPIWLATQKEAQSKLVRPSPIKEKPVEGSRQPGSTPAQQKTKEQWANESKRMLDLKRPEEALTAANQAIRLDPNYAIAYNNKASALDDLKRYEEALAAYEQAIRLNPNYAIAYNNKAVTLLNLKRYEEALAACEQAIHLDPTLALAYSNKGLALMRLNRYNEAITAFEQAIRLDPNYAIAYNNKASTLLNLKRYNEALTACEQALILDPDFANAYSNKGLALNGLNRYNEAITAFEQAIRLDPTLALAYNNKANTLINLKRYEEALAACEQALILDPNFAKAYYIKGRALEKLWKRKEAQQAYERAKQLGFSG